MNVTGEILLWRAVIDRAARDAFGCTDSNLYRHQGLRWFFQKLVVLQQKLPGYL